jgi:serine/threonine protein kinase
VGADDLRRVEKLFHAALNRKPEERMEFLAKACRRDPETRAKVESLLAARQDAGSFLERPAISLGENALSLVGRRVGRYLILSQIATGGMGVVYLAEHEESHRNVALKGIRSELATPRMLRRFEREGRVLGRLQHPGIARILESGVADLGEGPQPFFAMELVTGQPLTTHAESVHLALRERLELLADVSDTIHYAHQKGIIHCDLKPANILVDPSGRTKILDFGIAHAADSDLRTTSVPTGAAELMGTIQYMSPEQLTGNRQDLDSRSDIYALGVIGFELLAGRLPYQLGGKDLNEAVRIIGSVNPPRLGTIDPRLIGDIERVIGKALMKDRKRRFASAAGLSDGIRRYLRAESIETPPGILHRVRTILRGRRGER